LTPNLKAEEAMEVADMAEDTAVVVAVEVMEAEATEEVVVAAITNGNKKTAIKADMEAVVAAVILEEVEDKANIKSLTLITTAIVVAIITVLNKAVMGYLMKSLLVMI
jgi:uncharacterized protein (UPF0371 family)